MKKKKFLIGLLFIALLLFSASIYRQARISPLAKREISVSAEAQGLFIDWDVCRYYGTYDGCIILMVPSPMMAIGNVSVGPYTFQHSTLFQLYAYHDGLFVSLEDAYTDGLLSDRQIVKIYQRHLYYVD